MCAHSASVLSPNEFCDEIAEAIERGQGVVPLIGAGASVAAGIPAVRPMMRHITLCIGMALGLDWVSKDNRVPNGVFWHPRFSDWPRMSGDWVERADHCERVLAEVITMKPNEKSDMSGEQRKVVDDYLKTAQAAAGSLSDWRLALQFLSRLVPTQADKWIAPQGLGEAENGKLTESKRRLRRGSSAAEAMKGWSAKIPKGGDDGLERVIAHRKDMDRLAETLGQCLDYTNARLELADDDQHVVDSYFNFLTAGRTPAMTHRMLVHWVHALRSRVILTLNFDDLIEQAFREAGQEPAVFEVHREAQLPTLSLLRETPALVKLHGGHWGVRAGFSVDSEPTDQEKRHFASYFLGHDCPAETGGTSPRSPVRNHLVVAGVSGYDTRVKHLVRSAIARFPMGKKDEKEKEISFTVYWLCYSAHDQGVIQGIFKDEVTDGRIKIVSASHIGLVFAEAYQRVARCMPPGGLEFPATWQLPIPPVLTTDEETQLGQFNEEWLKPAKGWLENDESRVLILREAESAPLNKPLAHWGITAAGWSLFKDWNHQRQCLWLDMEDVGDASELFRRLLQAVEARLGYTHHAPTLSDFKSDDENLRDELDGLCRRSPTDWVLFLNCRGSHSYGANLFDRLEGGKRDQRASWAGENGDGTEWTALAETLSQVCAQGRRMKLVCLERREEQLFKAIQADDHTLCLWKKPYEPLELESWAEDNVPKVIAGTGENVVTLRRFRALAIFPPVRHITALVSRSIGVPDPEQAPHSKDPWEHMEENVKVLVEARIARLKPGGFLWMHWKTREELRTALSKGNFASALDERRPDLHLGLADWCMTFFESTRDPLAAFQAIYHRCMYANLAGKNGESDDPTSQVQSRSALCEAMNHLDRAQASVFAWGSSKDAEQCINGLRKVLVRHIDAAIGRQKAGEESGPIARAIAAFGQADHSRKVIESIEAFNKTVSSDKAVSLVRATYEAARPIEAFNEALCSDEAIRSVKAINEAVRSIEAFRDDLAKLAVYELCLFRDVGDHDALDTAVKALELDKENWGFITKQESGKAKWLTFQVDLEKATNLIARRQYDKAAQTLKDLLKKNCGYDEESDRSSTPEEIWKAVYEWTAKEGGDQDKRLFRFEVRRYIVCILRRLLEIELLKEESLQLLDLCDVETTGSPEPIPPLPRTGAETAGSNKFLKTTGRYYQIARMLPRFITDTSDSRLRVELSRLHSVKAGVLALDAVATGGFDGVQRHINESLAALNRLPESEDSIARAVVDLRRVYCKIQQLRSLKTVIAFGKEYRGGSDFNNPAEDEITRAEALLPEMDEILRTIERRLSRDRKSLWWWMTYCRVRMVWYEFSALLRAWRYRQPTGEMEKFRLALASYDENQIACELLGDARRRVTTDAFQLCRIAHAGHNMSVIAKTTFGEGGVGMWQAELEKVRTIVESFRRKWKSEPETEPNPDVVKYVGWVADHILQP